MHEPGLFKLDQQIKNQEIARCDTCNEPDFDEGLLRKTQCQCCWEAFCEKAFWEEIDKGELGVFGGIY